MVNFKLMISLIQALNRSNLSYGPSKIVTRTSTLHLLCIVAMLLYLCTIGIVACF